MKTGLIAYDSRFDFSSQTLHEHIIKISQSGLSGLLLLAAFPKITGKPYKCLGP